MRLTVKNGRVVEDPPECDCEDCDCDRCDDQEEGDE